MSPRGAFGYRPFIATDAAVAAVGEVELEFGYVGFREDHGSATIIAPEIVANLGFARDLELVGEFQVAHDLGGRQDEDPTRFEDSAVSLKWVFRNGVLQDQGPRPSLAVELSVLLPAVNAGNRPGGELVGILSGRAFGFAYHLNAGTLVEPGGSEPGAIWGIIAEHAVAGGLRAVAEVDGESLPGRAPENSALVGAIWDVPAPWPLRELSFDIGVRRGLNPAADDWGGTAGLTFAFPLGGGD
jgi:hypothetical protein